MYRVALECRKPFQKRRARKSAVWRKSKSLFEKECYICNTYFGCSCTCRLNSFTYYLPYNRIDVPGFSWWNYIGYCYVYFWFVFQIRQRITKEWRRNIMIVLKLDKVMKERGVKLKDLAVKIGLTDANLSNIKTSKISAIRFSTLNALCKELNCQPADILEYSEDK